MLTGSAARELESLDRELVEKFDRLTGILTEMGSVLIAFSGGVDSTFLLKVASLALSENAAALTATSPTYLERELAEAEKAAEEFGVKHYIRDSNELEISGFAENTTKRCYYCKSELFRIALNIAKKEGYDFVLDGTNLDDLGDFRPGSDAAKELQVRSPLVEANLSKTDIRELSRALSLSTADKPALACLSSRFPYGTEITEERLKMVAQCEELLRSLGVKQLRVRYHNDTARIEVEQADINLLLDKKVREKVIRKFKEAGFTYVTLDLEGYRTGSMNEVL
ncbi:MAG: ATP-dependent sacrificial sulfur transferase LarE [Thermodesulfobacteriota bacterium]